MKIIIKFKSRLKYELNCAYLQGYPITEQPAMYQTMRCINCSCTHMTYSCIQVRSQTPNKMHPAHLYVNILNKGMGSGHTHWSFHLSQSDFTTIPMYCVIRIEKHPCSSGWPNFFYNNKGSSFNLHF